jgi:asparagine synthase (glutamine-hydrolysing)
VLPADGPFRDGADGVVEVVGDAARVHVLAAPDLCLVSDDPVAMRDELRRRGRLPAVDPLAVSEFLHHGFVTAPRSMRHGLYRLGVGDVLALIPGGGYRESYRFPWPNAGSRGDTEPSTDRLLELLTAAVTRSVGDGPATLMLSSGKDSVALALACREAGRTDVRTVTFTSGDDGEAADASAFARRLGLAHRTITLPDDAERIEQVMARYFATASEPCGDPTLIPYLLAVDAAEPAAGERLIDGANSDVWMVYVPSRAEVRGSRISDRWLWWARPLRGLFPPESPVSAALRSRAEWHFFGGRWLRHADTRRFFAGSRDTHRDWLARSRDLRSLDDFDFRSRVRGRNYEQNAAKLKGQAAGEAFGIAPAFPYDDRELADWWHHLPERWRFDRANLVNKVLLRQLLRERVDYDDQRLGKRVFEFDGEGFLTRHRVMVEREITACPLWNDAVGSLVRGLLDRPAALRKTWPSLVALYQLSGWLTRNLP